MGPWYWDMEERLHNPFFIGARAWNGPIEGWVGKNRVYRRDLPTTDARERMLQAVEEARGAPIPEVRGRPGGASDCAVSSAGVAAAGAAWTGMRGSAACSGPSNHSSMPRPGCCVSVNACSAYVPAGLRGLVGRGIWAHAALFAAAACWRVQARRAALLAAEQPSHLDQVLGGRLFKDVLDPVAAREMVAAKHAERAAAAQ
jgi:hypothetical protein